MPVVVLSFERSGTRSFVSKPPSSGLTSKPVIAVPVEGTVKTPTMALTSATVLALVPVRFWKTEAR